MEESKLAKKQIEKIQAKLDRASKSGFSTKSKEELLNEIKKRLGLS
ncbi:hypothetical protein [Flavobacterium soyangense]|uniref:Uncharacterized protein n=1 Tax=Flavobacterium soyangense TaxID=2023265 RepID=A0A930U932_9FLAO|nr:hypothetical protein [Flavobacterium soyangense]MBF2707735.1 hypothetical protein [Flavobacterium soyangense]